MTVETCAECGFDASEYTPRRTADDPARTRADVARPDRGYRRVGARDAPRTRGVVGSRVSRALARHHGDDGLSRASRRDRRPSGAPRPGARGRRSAGGNDRLAGDCRARQERGAAHERSARPRRRRLARADHPRRRHGRHRLDRRPRGSRRNPSLARRRPQSARARCGRTDPTWNARAGEQLGRRRAQGAAHTGDRRPARCCRRHAGTAQ